MGRSYTTETMVRPSNRWADDAEPAAEKASRSTFEVFAWGHGYVGSRPTLTEAFHLAADYEGARIIAYRDGVFEIVARLGLYASNSRR
ncbi:MAG: hypothetical protein ACYC1C_02265 [Chloroflexota bacterium]